MRMRRLGLTGPELSVIGFGAWQAGGKGWGANPPDSQVIRSIHAAFDAGINWIDTAEIYGDGHSEEVIGRALAERPQMLVASKVAPRPSGSGFSPTDIRAACEHSLQRLNRDYIDLYQLHWPADDGTVVENTWGAMQRLVEAGLVKHIGVSNFGRNLIQRCEHVHHVDSLQPQLSLLRPSHRDLTEWCAQNGTGVITYSPLGCGLLSGDMPPGHAFDSNDWRSGNLWKSELYDQMFAPGKIEHSHAVVAAIGDVAARLGLTRSQLALAWNVQQPGVTATIVGTRVPEHAIENAAAGDVVLDNETLLELERLVPLGPAFR